MQKLIVLLRVSTTCRGFTFAETLIGSVIFAVLSWGIMSTYMSIARILIRQDTSDYAEAIGYASQTMEKYRNIIACAPLAHADEWFDDNCAENVGQLTGQWIIEPFPVTVLANGGTESIFQQPITRRLFCVKAFDCDGTAGVGDCYQMNVAVCWNDLTTCPIVDDFC